MSITTCRECEQQVSSQARVCPHCGIRFPGRHGYKGTGMDWKSEATILGMPLIHIAYGRDAQGRLRVARGFIAIGQFAIGFITIAQFGIGVIFGFGQFLVGLVAISQFAGGLLFGLGQFATGYAAIGQFALGGYVLCQTGFGEYIWSTTVKHPEAVEFFRQLAAEFGLTF